MLAHQLGHESCNGIHIDRPSETVVIFVLTLIAELGIGFIGKGSWTGIGRIVATSLRGKECRVGTTRLHPIFVIPFLLSSNS